MEILVGIDAADDEAVGDALLDLHGRTRRGNVLALPPTPNAWTGQ